MKKILITGAAGDVGGHLRRELAGRYALRLSDIRPVADLAAEEEFIRGDCATLRDMLRVTSGVDAVVHLGGFSVEGPWETILRANIVGTYNAFEAAGMQRILVFLEAATFVINIWKEIKEHPKENLKCS